MSTIVVFSHSGERQKELIAKVEAGGFEIVPDGQGDLVIVDAVSDEVGAFAKIQSVKAGDGPPVIAVLGAGRRPGPDHMAAVDDFIFEPFVDDELWLRLDRLTGGGQETKAIRIDGLVIRPDTYEALIDGTPLNLTFKEYELLKFLAGRPGRVWDRQTLLNQIWDYDYFGGTRTVDVHIRRLRSKLGRYADLIQTVRQVGYKFNRSA